MWFPGREPGGGAPVTAEGAASGTALSKINTDRHFHSLPFFLKVEIVLGFLLVVKNR